MGILQEHLSKWPFELHVQADNIIKEN